MKKRITLAISLFMLFIASISLFAQEQTRPTREQMREKMRAYQWNSVCKALALDDATKAKFEPIYKKYQAELGEVMKSCRPDRPESAPDQADKKPSRPELSNLTDQQAEEMILLRLDGAVKMAEIHKKYYAEFKKVLSPKQILKVYDTEMQMRNRVGEHFKHRSQRSQGMPQPNDIPIEKR